MKISIIEFNKSHYELLPSYYYLLSNSSPIFFVNNALPQGVESKLLGSKVQRIHLSKSTILDSLKLTLQLRSEKK